MIKLNKDAETRLINHFGFYIYSELIKFDKSRVKNIFTDEYEYGLVNCYEVKDFNSKFYEVI